MRIYLCLVAVLQAVFIGTAAADLAKPDCDQMWRGYEAIASTPIYTSDLTIVVNALADNNLMASDATRTRFASREDISAHLKKLTPIQALEWIGKRYGELDLELQRMHCPQYKQIRIQLMLPK